MIRLRATIAAVSIAAALACRPAVRSDPPTQPTEPCVRDGLSPDSPACMQRLSQEGYVYFESTPPGARVWVDGVDLGPAPLWKKLALGRHTVECKSPKDRYLPMPIEAGRDPSVVCQRQNSESAAVENETFTTEEKAGGIFIFLGSLAATAGLILLPFLIF